MCIKRSCSVAVPVAGALRHLFEAGQPCRHSNDCCAVQESVRVICSVTVAAPALHVALQPHFEEFYSQARAQMALVLIATVRVATVSTALQVSRRASAGRILPSLMMRWWLCMRATRERSRCTTCIQIHCLSESHCESARARSFHSAMK